MIENQTTLKKAIKENSGTPCAVIDLDVVERNIAKAQSLCDEAGMANRPPMKTHKSPVMAQMQICAGARGIPCQKLGEAEVMANAGITDILIATKLLGAAQCDQLAALQKRLPLNVCADNLVSLAEYSKAAACAGRALDVLIECDTGQRRAGVETPVEALLLAKKIKADPMLNFAGLPFYPSLDSWPETQVFYDEITDELSKLGLTADLVSTGSTPDLVNLGKLNGATEHRAGTCIFNDLMMMKAGVATLADCAFQVYTSVVSRGSSDRGILDAGSKTLSSDTGGQDGFGRIIEHPTAWIHKFAEEHGFLDLSTCKVIPEVGDIFRVIPNLVCISVKMFNQMVAVRSGKISRVIPVAARGRLV